MPTFKGCQPTGGPLLVMTDSERPATRKVSTPLPDIINVQDLTIKLHKRRFRYFEDTFVSRVYIVHSACLQILWYWTARQSEGIRAQSCDDSIPQ